MEPRELPDLPFGVSLHDHLIHYLDDVVVDVRKTFARELETAKRIGNQDAIARLETAVDAVDTFSSDIRGIVDFVDREMNFYDVPTDLPVDATLVKVFEPTEYNGKQWVRVVFEAGGVELMAKFLDLDTCEAVVEALNHAIEQGRSEE